MEIEQIKPLEVVRVEEPESSGILSNFPFWMIGLLTFIDFDTVSILLRNNMGMIGLLMIVMSILTGFYFFVKVVLQTSTSCRREELEKLERHIVCVDKKVDDRLYEVSLRDNDTHRYLNSMRMDFNELKAFNERNRTEQAANYISVPEFEPLKLPAAKISLKRPDNGHNSMCHCQECDPEYPWMGTDEMRRRIIDNQHEVAQLKTALTQKAKKPRVSKKAIKTADLHEENSKKLDAMQAEYKHLSLCATRVPQPYKDKLRSDAKEVFKKMQEMVCDCENCSPDNYLKAVFDTGEVVLRRKQDPWVACVSNSGLLSYKHVESGEVIPAEKHPRYAKLDDSDGSVFCGKKLPVYVKKVDSKGHVTVKEINCTLCNDEHIVRGRRDYIPCPECSSDSSSFPVRPEKKKIVVVNRINADEKFRTEKERLEDRYKNATEIADTYKKMGIESQTLNIEAEEAHTAMVTHNLREIHFKRLGYGKFKRLGYGKCRGCGKSCSTGDECGWCTEPGHNRVLCMFCTEPFLKTSLEHKVCSACSSSEKDTKISEGNQTDPGPLIQGTKDLLFSSAMKRSMKNSEPPAEIQTWINKLVEPEDTGYTYNENGEIVLEPYHWIEPKDREVLEEEKDK